MEISKDSLKDLHERAMKADRKALKVLVSVYLDKINAKGNYYSAVGILMADAQDGDHHALFELGTRFLSGDGVPQDDKLSIEGHELAAMFGNVDGLKAMWSSHTYGYEVEKDDDKAREWAMRLRRKSC
jgi:TPR repeat protein